MKRSCVALVLLCLLALPLMAAAEGWEIVRADYGSENNWVDVTDRVRSLVQDGNLKFRVGRSTLPNDGRQGRRVLRLQLRDSEGRTRQVSYRDRQQVNLQINTTNYGTLRIDRAIYGSGYRNSDVTARLGSQVQGNHLNLQVNNSTMGGDPAPNQSKTLRVDYTLNGRTNQALINEGDMLRLGYGESTENNGTRLFAFKPDATDHLAAFTQAVMRGPGPLTPGERELLAALTSQENDCPF